jgi:beta-glucosidase
VKGAEQAEESFAKGRNVILAPGIASGRTPLAGRTPEYFGEDPLLSGLLGAQMAEGIESTGKVVANLKHYVANEQELDRQTSSSNMDDRTMREVYGLPYEIAAQRSDAESVMCSFNQVNGVYACESPIQRDLLKADYGFSGFIMSDFGSVHSTAASLMNGLDQELNRPIWFTPEKLDAALAAGDITQARIDEAATLVIKGYIEGGLFDNPLPAAPATEASTPEGKAIAKQIAEDGSVLLKNDGVLPLDVADGQTIAIIGPTASSTPTSVSGVPTSAVSVCSLTLRFNPNAAPRNTLPCEDVVSAESALTARAAEVGASVVWNNGQDVAAASALAATADVAVVFGYQRMGEFSDIPDLKLQGNGDALIGAVEQANPNTVVVLQTGSAVEMPWVGGVQAGARGLVRRRTAGTGDRVAALRRHRADRQAPDELPRVARRRAHEHARSSIRACSRTARRPVRQARPRSGRWSTPRVCRSATSGTRNRGSIRSSPSATASRTRRSRTTRSRSRRRARTARRRSGSSSGSPTPGIVPARTPRRRT